MTPSTEMSRFLVCFSKTIYKVKNYRSGKNQIIRSKLKGGIFYLKILLLENSEVVKSLPSRERKLKSANLSLSTDALKGVPVMKIGDFVEPNT